MKLAIKRNFVPVILALLMALFGAACEKKPAGSSASGTPTEAYKNLYEAVKAKNAEATKAVMSKQTLAFAEGVAKRQNIPYDKVFENGFTATTFSPNLPETRDERVKDGFGAVEVYNSKDSRWEDLPFVLEDGKWKLAIGDIFSGSFKSPGKARSVLEMEAANAQGNGMTIMNTNQPGSFSSGKSNMNDNPIANINPNAGANANANTNVKSNANTK